MRLALAAILLAVLACLLSACGVYYEHRTHVRELPDEVATTLTAGDSREKVRSILGEPLVDARALGVEVYRKSGRDFGVIWVLVPWTPYPIWGGEVSVFTLVLYDESDLIADIKSKFWTSGDFQISAGGYDFVNGSTTSDEPDTLIGPLVTWEKRAKTLNEDDCTLVLVHSAWAMERISVDDLVIADLSIELQTLHNLHGTFFEITIEPGEHRVNVNQKSWRGNFETTFECGSGDIVYAELEAFHASDSWWDLRIRGSVVISEDVPEKHAKKPGLRPILWHSGTWYGKPRLNRQQE